MAPGVAIGPFPLVKVSWRQPGDFGVFRRHYVPRPWSKLHQTSSFGSQLLAFVAFWRHGRLIVRIFMRSAGVVRVATISARDDSRLLCQILASHHENFARSASETQLPLVPKPGLRTLRTFAVNLFANLTKQCHLQSLMFGVFRGHPLGSFFPYDQAFVEHDGQKTRDFLLNQNWHMRPDEWPSQWVGNFGRTSMTE